MRGPNSRRRIGVLFMQSQTYFGADSRIHSLIMAELDRSRFEVHAAANRGTRWDPSASLPALREIPDVRIRPTSFATSINFRSWTQRIRDTLVSGPRSVFSLLGLLWYARRHRIDIVHCTEKPRDAFYGYLVARAAGAKCLIHLHVGVNHDWMLSLTRFAMRHADGLIGCSNYVRRTAIESGYPADHCYAIANALDSSGWDPSIDGNPIREEYAISADTVVVTIISRVYSWKGHTELLKALAKVRPEFDGFKLLLVGEDDIRAQPGHGSYLAELGAMVTDLGLDEHVVFTGFRADIAPLLAASDIFAMPSFEEPFGVVFLEAQAMRVPVVAVDNGGTPEAVADGHVGLLSRPYDIDGVAANLLRLMRDPALRREMGAAGRRRVLEYYTPRRLAADAEVVYEHVLGVDGVAHPNEVD